MDSVQGDTTTLRNDTDARRTRQRSRSRQHQHIPGGEPVHLPLRDKPNRSHRLQQGDIVTYNFPVWSYYIH